MLKGDLATTRLGEILTTLHEAESTGCLHIVPADDGDEALVYLKSGIVYSAFVPGRRPQLGSRLVSSGALAPESLEEALDAQQTELHGWRLGELLVHLGFVDRDVVEDFVLEQLREAAYDLSGWTEGTWKFRKNEKTREDVGGRCTVPDLLAEVDRRYREWELINPVVHGPDAVPMLSSAGVSASEMTLDQDQWALLCKVDGERTIGQLARDCGFTTFEAGQVVFSLVSGGLLEVEESLADEYAAEDAERAPMSTSDALSSAIAMLGGIREVAEDLDDGAAGAGDDDYGTLSRLSSALLMPLTADESVPSPDDADPLADDNAASAEMASEWSDLLSDGADVPDESELSRLFSYSDDVDPEDSPAASAWAELDLPDLTGPETLEPETLEPDPALEWAGGTADLADEDPLARVSAALSALLAGPPTDVEPVGETSLAARHRDIEPVSALSADELAELERTRSAAAAELAIAHALAEDERRQRDSHGQSELENIVASLREDAADAELAESLLADSLQADVERAEAARADEEAARAAAEAEQLEAEQLEAERAEAEQAAADEEAARLEAEQLEAEQLEADRLEAEQAAADEAARLEAEQLEAEQAAAAEAARLEADQLEAEQAAVLEAARLEAEQAAADEAARLEAEQLEAEQLEAEQAAVLEAARLEAEQLEAEQAAVLEAAHRDAERAAADEAARLEAEQLEAELLAQELAALDDDDPEVAVDEIEPIELEQADPGGAAAMLRDFSSTAPEPVAPEPEAEPEPAEEPEAERPAGRPARNLDNDTASLLRELSSLGLDDEPPPSAPTPPARPAGGGRPATPAKESPKKRKGLFSR